MNEPWNYPLFEHMSIEYSLDLLDTEMDEIIRIALECERRRQESLKSETKGTTLDEAPDSEDGVRLKIAMDALSDISEIPRSGRAGRLAKAVLRFLKAVKPVSFGPSFVNPPNDQPRGQKI